MARNKELYLVMSAVLLSIAILAFASLTTSCSLKWINPDGDSIVNPESTYHAAHLGMTALLMKEPTVAAIICWEASDTLWPILESATQGTIGLKDDVIQILIDCVSDYGVEGDWVALMSPALHFLNAAFQPEVEFKDNWLDILKAFTGGIIDACKGTTTHKP